MDQSAVAPGAAWLPAPGWLCGRREEAGGRGMRAGTFPQELCLIEERAQTHKEGPLRAGGECLVFRGAPRVLGTGLGLEGELSLALGRGADGGRHGACFRGWHSPDQWGGLLPETERKVVPALDVLQDGRGPEGS